jgi:hypothetical protein
MPWVKDIDLEQRLEKAKHLFQDARSSLSEEKEKEFYRLSGQVNAVQSQLTRSLSLLAHLISQTKRDRRNLLLVAIPLILLFGGARYFEIDREWQSKFALVFALLILFFFELRL